ncbi:MAG: hypothetical protein HY547_07390 [Elusimicrobia bacterium]|nr:hypothetical protein [Elusimicrobiota bacterium]
MRFLSSRLTGIPQLKGLFLRKHRTFLSRHTGEGRYRVPVRTWAPALAGATFHLRNLGLILLGREALVLVCAGLLATTVFAQEATAKNRKPKTAEEMLFYGIDLYQEGQMEDALETFMTVMRMGPSVEESALAREYIDRISYRMAGKSPQIKVESSTAAVALANAPEVSTASAGAAHPITEESTGAMTLDPLPPKTTPAVVPAPEALIEYVGLKLSSRRRTLIEKFKKYAPIGLVLRGTDKLLAVAIPEEMLFSKGAAFRKDAGEFLKLSAEAVYYHPKNVIRIYPGHLRGRSSIENLQRATVLGSYLTGSGVAPSRVEVDLEGSPKFYFGRDTAVPPSLDSMARHRDGRVLFIFEDFSDPLETQYYFTKYLPMHNVSKEFSTLVLGVSRDKIDARVGEGMVIEIYAHSEPAAIAQWNLRLIAPDGGVVWVYEGHGPVLDSFYFEGKKDAVSDFEMLLSGRYTLEAQALSVTGGKIRAVKTVDVLGKEPPKPGTMGNAVSTPAASAKTAIKPKPTTKKAGTQSKSSSKTSKGTSSAAAVAALPASGAKRKPQVQTADAASAASLGPAKGKTETIARPTGSPPPTTLTNFKISFSHNEASVSKNQLSMLAEMGQAAKMHPSQRLNLIGYAAPDERDPEDLAQARVQAVVKLLTSDYEVAGSRLNVESGLGDEGQRYVEVFVEQ